MFKIRQTLSFAPVALATVSAQAAPAPTGPASRVDGIVDRSDLSAAQAVLAQRDYDTTCLMSTGRRLSASSSGDALRIRYGRRAEAWLVRDCQGRFALGDGELSLRFALDEDGKPQLVRLVLPAVRQ